MSVTEVAERGSLSVMSTDTAAPTLPDALGDAARAFIAGPHRL